MINKRGALYVLADEGRDVQATSLGSHKHEMLFNLICKQTNLSQNCAEMNQLSPSGWLARVGENAIPSLPLAGLAADSVRGKDPAQGWHMVYAQ